MADDPAVPHTPQVQQFLAALDALCAQYGLCMETYGYEKIILRPRTLEDAISIDPEDFVDTL